MEKPSRLHRRQLIKGSIAMGAGNLMRPWAAHSQGARMPIEGPFRTREELAASLASTGVSTPDQHMLLASAQPSVGLQSRAAEDGDIPIGRSKIGGAPDLPRGMAWPERQPTSTGAAAVRNLRKLDAETPSDYFKNEIALKEPLAARVAPLIFMLQVDLAACWAVGDLDPDIPGTGWLSLFYDLVFRPWYGHEADSKALFQVLYITGNAADLVRQAPPDLGYPLFAGLEAYRNCLPPARLTPVFTYTLPDGGTLRMLKRWVADGQFPHKAWLDQRPTHLQAANRVGGWPENIQGDMAIELAAIEAGITLPVGEAFIAAAHRLQPLADQWVHLLQIGDYDTTVNDFDGLYHVWIKREHLRARDFTKARLIYRTS